jgi:hypothetical protein
MYWGLADTGQVGQEHNITAAKTSFLYGIKALKVLDQNV